MEVRPVHRSQARLWLQVNGGGPADPPAYQGLARVTSANLTAGAVTLVRQTTHIYGQFEVVGAFRGPDEPGGVTIEARRAPGIISTLLSLFNRRCEFDAQVHMGDCENPQDFLGGWTTARLFESLLPANWQGGDMGAFDEGGDGPIADTLDVDALRIYDVHRLRPSATSVLDFTGPVVDMVICDSVTCTQCGLPSDGCQVVFALLAAPGAPAVAWTANGGDTQADWGHSTPPQLAGSLARALACYGRYLLVGAEDQANIYFSEIASLVSENGTWDEGAEGLSGGVLAIATVRGGCWVSCVGGDIMFSATPTESSAEFNTQAATGFNVHALHAIDLYHAVGVGEGGFVTYLSTTANGPVWVEAVANPDAAATLLTVWMRSPGEWLVGANNGLLWHTRDFGMTWTEKTFPGSGTGTISRINFASRLVGYMAHTPPGGPGRVLRTIDGGHSWKVLPEQVGLTIPTNTAINVVAACRDNVNVVFGGGDTISPGNSYAVKLQ